MKTVLFICVGNSQRSQMAEAYFNHFANGRARAISAGTRPASRVDSKAIALMAEEGIDLSGKQPKLLTDQMVQQADWGITLGCGVAQSCALRLGASEDWELEDPLGYPVEKLRPLRDEIKARVLRLIQELELSDLTQ
jgi:arsenate reductase